MKKFGKLLLLVFCLSLWTVRGLDVQAAGYVTSVESQYTTNYVEAVNFLKQNMADRVPQVILNTDANMYSRLWDILDDASGYVESEPGYMGDAIALDQKGTSVSTRISGGNYRITYNLGYFMSQQQETELRAAVTKTLADLKIAGKDDYTKAKAIYDYICTHVTYDYDGLEAGTDEMMYSAYAAMMKGTAVCQGYASLFYRMAKEAGLSVRVVTGGMFDGGRHAWNIVKIGNVYYNVDCTWGSDSADAQAQYFLLGSLEYNQTYCDYEFTLPEFTNQFPISTFKYGQTFEKFNYANPTATFTDRNGKQQTTAANGKAKLVILFGYKCPNSQAFMSSLSRLIEEGYQLDVVAVDCQGAANSDLDAFVQTYGVHPSISIANPDISNNCYGTYRRWMNENGYDTVKTLPFIFYLDANNKLQYFCNAYQDFNQIATYLEVFCGAKKGNQKELTVTKQPSNVTAVAGDTAAFSVIADGDGVTYQWQYRNAGVTNWSNSGAAVAKTANMTFTVGTDKTLNGRQYRCVVTDQYGATLTTDAVTLTVVPKFAITSQPVNVTAKAGDKVTFSVKATGEGLTYQWQYRNAGVTTWSNSGAAAAKTANMTFTVGTDKTLNGRQYRCVVKDSKGSTLNTNAATLTVKSAVSITSQPANITAKAGDTVTFSVKASGDGLTYQWQYKNAGAADWVNSGIKAAKTANMTFAVGTDKTLNGRQYRCIVKDASGTSVTSNAATLTVSALAITSQPASVTAAVGAKATFTVKASGTGLTYQWQYKNANATTWSNSGIAAAKTATFSFTVGTDKTLNGRQYRCVVKDASGAVIESNAAVLTVK